MLLFLLQFNDDNYFHQNHQRKILDNYYHLLVNDDIDNGEQEEEVEEDHNETNGNVRTSGENHDFQIVFYAARLMMTCQ